MTQRKYSSPSFWPSRWAKPGQLMSEVKERFLLCTHDEFMSSNSLNIFVLMLVRVLLCFASQKSLSLYLFLGYVKIFHPTRRLAQPGHKQVKITEQLDWSGGSEERAGNLALITFTTTTIPTMTRCTFLLGLAPQWAFYLFFFVSLDQCPFWGKEKNIIIFIGRVTMTLLLIAAFHGKYQLWVCWKTCLIYYEWVTL